MKNTPAQPTQSKQPARPEQARPSRRAAGPLSRLFAYYTAYHEHGQLHRYMAILGLFAFPLLYLVRYLRPNAGYDDLAIRAVDTLLCLGLLLGPRWPVRVRPLFMPYSYLVLLVALPFTFVFTSLKHGGGPAAVGNTFFAVFMLMLVTDWRNMIVMLVTGVGLAAGLYFATEANPHVPADYVARLPVLVVGLIGGSLFKHALERASAERVRQAYASLAGSIAHEMRNPLAQVRHSFEHIREFLPVPSVRVHDQSISAGRVEQLYHHVSQGETAVRRGLQVIAMTLDEVNAKRFDASRLTLIRAGDLCSRSVQEFGYEDESERPRVSVQVRRDFFFRGDETALMFVLFNLLKNALHYLPAHPGMTVCLEVDAGAITVRDTGPGIPESVLPNLFLPFASSGKAGGTGLGLAYCHRVVAGLGGTITCQSVPGATAFSITLPAAPQAEIDRHREEVMTNARRLFSQRRVLVVDDDAAIRASSRQLLLSLLCTVREASDGFEALQALRESRFDLVLLDLSMPRMDGYEVAESVRSGMTPANTDTILLAHTAEPPHIARVKTAKAGFDGFVSKPGEPVDFIAAFQEALAARELAPARDAGWLAGRKILVADDNAYNRKSLVGRLRHAGAEVLEAGDGHAALECLSQRPDIDAVLMDMQMPGMGGIDAARAIRSGAGGNRGLPIIAVTGYSSAQVLAEGRAAGIDEFITKPVEADDLRVTLSRLLGIQSPVVAVPAPDAGASPLSAGMPLLDEVRLHQYQRLGMLAELVGEFAPRASALVGQIGHAVAGDDLQAALDALHSLVGMSGEAGARALYHHASSVYVPLRERHEWPADSQWVEHLQELTASSNHALRAWATGHGARAIG